MIISRAEKELLLYSTVIFKTIVRNGVKWKNFQIHLKYPNICFRFQKKNLTQNFSNSCLRSRLLSNLSTLEFTLSPFFRFSATFFNLFSSFHQIICFFACFLLPETKEEEPKEDEKESQKKESAEKRTRESKKNK